MKEGLYYEVKGKNVQCHICPNNCIISPSKFGICKARKNVNSKLIAWTYGKPCSLSIDPVEKKPLFHFYPGKRVYSFSTTGCNLKCKFCQNWNTSQAFLEDVPYKEMKPKQIVDDALENNCDMIAYTYTEPTIFYEFVLDTAKLAHKKGLKNITVTNGFINQKPLKRLYKYIDGVNVDLKAFNDDYYRKICGARLKPVLETIKTLSKMDVWLELTNLIVPGHNDDMKEIKKMCEWIKDLDDSIPLHFSRFFPCYKMADVKPTPQKTLMDAYKIAKKVGLKYVYVGNMFVDKEDDTFCPKCDKVLVKREGFIASDVKKKCSCGFKLDGRF